MKFRTEGLIIKEQNIGEQDKLVFALTKSNGVIRAFVRVQKTSKTANVRRHLSSHIPDLQFIKVGKVT